MARRCEDAERRGSPSPFKTYNGDTPIDLSNGRTPLIQDKRGRGKTLHPISRCRKHVPSLHTPAWTYIFPFRSPTALPSRRTLVPLVFDIMKLVIFLTINVIRPSSETPLRLSFPHSANYCAFQKNVNGTDTTALLFFVVTGKQKTPRGGEAGGDPAHPFFSSGPRAVLRNRFLPLNGRRLLFFPVQPILQNPLHEEYRCALFSRGINVPSWRRLRPIYGMKAFHRSGMGSRFEVPRTSNFFPGLRGFCAERSSSIALRAQRGIATAGHMNLSSIVALSGADFACAPDSFMSRLDGIQVLQAGKVKDRGRMQFHRQRRGGFCEPPRLRMIMERI